MAVERFKCCENIEVLAKELGVPVRPYIDGRKRVSGQRWRRTANREVPRIKASERD
jgi:hypothetical protein